MTSDLYVKLGSSVCINILHTNHDIKDKLHILLTNMQKLSNRKGLSTVITTLIILVVAVLLAGIVTYYATNMVMVRTAQEELRISKHHIWVSENDHAYAAFMLQNLGSRDILIDKITVRGVQCPWSDIPENIAITAEFLDMGDGSQLTFSGTLDKPPAIENSVSIEATVNAATVTITDDGIGGLSSATGTTGTIDYVTGDWTLDFSGEPAPSTPDDGTPIVADYTGTKQVKNHYYLVQEGEDDTGDFVLIQTAGKVEAKIDGVLPTVWDDATSDMPLKSSGTMLFFIEDPVNVGLQDVGTTISLTVFTTNGQWIIETNVEAAEIN